MSSWFYRVGMAAAPHKTKTLQFLNFFLKPFLYPVASAAAATCLQLSIRGEYNESMCRESRRKIGKF